VMTHDHAEDLAICDAALRDPRVASIGLIGSAAKWTRFRRLLTAEGHPPETVNRIACPVGRSDIASKAPVAIAVAIAAEVLARLGPRRTPASTPTTVNPSGGPCALGSPGNTP